MIKLKYQSWFLLKYRLWSPMFSPQCDYACYLVFKFNIDFMPDKICLFNVEYKLDGISQGTLCAYLSEFAVNIPTLKPKDDGKRHESSNTPTTEGPHYMTKGHMERLGYTRIEERKDGWVEVMLCKPLDHSKDPKSLEMKFTNLKDANFHGIIFEGMEFRPVQRWTNV